MMIPIDDTGRTFRTLRVSLINTCNLGCIYCTCGTEDLQQNSVKSKSAALSVHQLSAIIKKLHHNLDLSTIRFTGGEPLLYKGLSQITANVRAMGISSIKLTTNGILLDRMIADLKTAGISSVNVSIDAIDEEIFFRMGRRNGVAKVLAGIDKAISLGLEVKLNAVIMKGMNENQVIPLLEYAFQRNIKIRFLEIMAMGYLHGQADKHFFSQQDILSLIRERYTFEREERLSASTSNYWKTPEGHVFGVIANESEPFCADCNRLRLDSFGNIYGCLSSNNPVSLLGVENENEVYNKLVTALKQKQATRFTGSALSMLHIGG